MTLLSHHDVPLLLAVPAISFATAGALLLAAKLQARRHRRRFEPARAPLPASAGGAGQPAAVTAARVARAASTTPAP